MLLQHRLDVLVLVVDRRVEAQLAREVLALLGPARDPDHAAAHDLGDLPDDRADRARGARHHHGLACLRLAHVQQPEVRGHAGHAERAEVDRQGNQPRVDLHHALAVGERVLLHAEPSGHHIAHGEFRVARLHHLAGAARAHHLADRHRPDVRLALVHPAPHRRVERQVAHLDEDLPLARIGHRLVRDLPVARLGQPDWTRREPHLPVFHAVTPDAAAAALVRGPMSLYFFSSIFAMALRCTSSGPSAKRSVRTWA
jgi:hypothetical protein